MYKVIRHFTDLQDGGHPYQVGDVFPRPGLDVTAARLEELAGVKNRQRTPLIQSVSTATKAGTKKPARKPAEK